MFLGAAVLAVGLYLGALVFADRFSIGRLFAALFLVAGALSLLT